MNEVDVDWRLAFEASLDDEIRVAERIGGGDIGDSFRVSLASGGVAFVKHYHDAPSGLAACEARGLEWLAQAEAEIRIPRRLGYASDWLALEWIETRPPAPEFDCLLGEGLAGLHGAAPPRFGFGEANWIGTLPQTNDVRPSWADFYGANRIRPLQRRASDAGLLPGALSRRLDRLVEDLPQLVGADEPVARLHGDLWSGNVLVDERGLPCLIDPACYGGHREVDLAMMKLFGGFEDAVFEAYERASPLSPESGARVALYQIYPLLVHLCLFGGSYLRMLNRTVANALG